MSKGLPGSCKAVLAVAVVFIVISGCEEQGRSGFVPDHLPSLSEHVEWESPLILEEIGDTLVGVPYIRTDPLGGWLYWDARVPQVRRYTEDGALVVAMGREGGGPGEFSRVVAFMRTASGALVSVGQGGRIATWEDTGELVNEFSIGVAPVAGAVLAGDRLLVFSTFGLTPHPASLPWMHVVDLELGSVVEAHPAPEMLPDYAAAAVSVGGPQPRTFGDFIYAGFSVLDTIWSWPSGALDQDPERMSVPSVTIHENEPPPPTAPDFGPFRSWFEESWFLGGFVRLADGRWLYQIWASGEEGLLGRLLLTDVDGAVAWEANANNLRILDADAEGRVYLWDAAGMNPAEILVARVH